MIGRAVFYLFVLDLLCLLDFDDLVVIWTTSCNYLFISLSSLSISLDFISLSFTRFTLGSLELSFFIILDLLFSLLIFGLPWLLLFSAEIYLSCNLSTKSLCTSLKLLILFWLKNLNSSGYLGNYIFVYSFDLNLSKAVSGK